MGILIGKYSILTLGCRVNQYESQVISERLEALGLLHGQFDDICQVYIINSCAVTEESVRKTRQMIRRAYKKNPNAFIAVCGCASQLEYDAFVNMDGVGFVCGTRDKDSVIEAVSAYIDGHSKDSLNQAPSGELAPTQITHFDRTRAYVKIEDGCEGKCSYCIIPKVRGGIVLRPEEEILSEVTSLAKSGCREVVLTGIETSAYGSKLSELITKISRINGIERIRLGSLDPSFIKPDFIDAICDIPQVCPHFHISVQNGSDRILAAMKRRYNTAVIERNIDYIRSKMPRANFSADVIVGFPSETEDDFELTCEFVKRIGFLHLHIFTYSKRPGTEAAEMKEQISEAVKTSRLHRLSEIANREKDRILRDIIQDGEAMSVLVESVTDGALSGHTDSFVECSITIKNSIEPSLLKGTFISAIPYDLSCGKLICKLRQ